MPREKLNDRLVRSLKPETKPYAVFDGHGLYMYVTPGGSKLWRHKYRLNGKERLISYGDFPTVSLSMARDECIESRRLIRQGIDPVEHRRQAKRQQERDEFETGQTFEVVARRWLDAQGWKDNTRKRRVADFENHLFPALGGDPIKAIGTQKLGSVLRGLVDAGKIETAHRLRARCEHIFALAIADELMERNPARELQELKQLTAIPKRQPRPHLRPDELGGFWKALTKYDGYMVYKLAAQLNGYSFLRSLELRLAEWPEIDWENRIWTIPPERMKKNRHTGERHKHLVPLSTHALTVLRKLHKISGDDGYMFPQIGRPNKPMHENAILDVIQALGFQGIMTGHGFRHIASTWLNEQGFNVDAIEIQLNHTEVANVRDVYNHAIYMDERRKLMQKWGAYLKGLERNKAR